MSALRKESESILQFPKNERQIVSEKDDGYTPMPNFICDEGYLAVLDGDAIKCLIFINRYVKGFHLKAKRMPEGLVKKITGIKDGRTVQKYMAQLAQYHLIKIEKERGKGNTYSLTFNDRLPTQHVGTSCESIIEAPTFDAGGVPTQHVGGSTYTACRSYKEISLKENIKESEQENSVDEVLDLWTPDLHSLNSWLQRSGELPMTQELVNQILIEVNAHYEPRLKLGLITDTQMYSHFVKWVKRDLKIRQRLTTVAQPEQPTPQNFTEDKGDW